MAGKAGKSPKRPGENCRVKIQPKHDQLAEGFHSGDSMNVVGMLVCQGVESPLGVLFEEGDKGLQREQELVSGQGFF